MTKKDYVKLAQVFNTFRPKVLDDSELAKLCQNAEKATWLELREGICTTLAADNPRFDRERFIQATEA